MLPFAAVLVPPDEDGTATTEVTFWILLGLTLLCSGFGIHAWRSWRRERRRTIELAAEEQRFRTLFENARDVLFTLRPDGRIDSINGAITRLTGQPRESFAGQPFADLCADGAARESFAQHLENVVAHGSPGTTQFRIRGDDRERVLELCSHAVLESGTMIRIQGMARDVTMRVELERERVQSEQLDAIGRLSSGLAYDFNNILTIIRSQAEELRELATTLGSGDLSAGLDAILDETGRASLLTLQLTGQTRRSTGAATLLDVHEVIAQTIESLSHLLPEDIEFALELTAKPPHVFADSAVIEQILLNLLLNARDAMPEGGKIVVSTERKTITADTTAGTAADTAADGRDPADGAWLTLSVADSGHGMDAITQTKIFEPFFTTKDARSGSGLGLAVVQCALTRMGGHVAVESDPEHGSRFTVWLPWSDLLPSQTRTRHRGEPEGSAAPAPDTPSSLA